MVKIYGSRIALLTMLAWATSTGSVCAAETYTQSVATVSNYRAGSVQAQQVQAWLVQHASHVDGNLMGDPGISGDVRVSMTSTTVTKAGGVQTMSTGAPPPVPLPFTGSPGDTITITVTAGGKKQTWTYKWVGSATSGQWILIAYSFETIGATKPN